MKLDDAEILIRTHWDHIVHLAGQYSDRQRVATLATAAFVALQDRIRRELPWSHWRPLYDRLRVERHAEAINDRLGDKPVLCLLWGLIDRRTEFGIPEVQTGPGERYPNKASRGKGRRKGWTKAEQRHRGDEAT